ncbi:DUF2378 family protein [Pyxidicoccus xibeiensis]|uniref:DUF2378 family protein n=1 Tax=Pyxidicoccus xibeiensis TaxID=2906759 RepID=UPI0020A7E2DE|nr:DUF2378 family protein [Pyxidicoccus xibeiensis]MCP3136727.1 DUF2378 family protein [Pyxidicoccus xibeiensis]
MHLSTESTSAGGAAWELELRRLAASDEDTARGMFFQGTLDVVGFLGGEGAVARCKGVAGLWEINPVHMYPISKFLRMTSTAARLLAPQLDGFEGVLRRMGTQATVDFLSSMFGRDLMQTASGSPRKLLQSLGDSYRAAVSYGERYPLWTSEKSARFIMRRDFMPAAYHEGTLLSVLEAIGARDVRVHGRQVALLDSEYELSWK